MGGVNGSTEEGRGEGGEEGGHVRVGRGREGECGKGEGAPGGEGERQIYRRLDFGGGSGRRGL